MDLIYYVACSLDGFIADKDGGVEWLADSDNFGYSEFYASVDSLIIGSRTYQQILDFDAEWPYKGKPCWVMTSTPGTPLNSDVHITALSPSDVLEEMRSHGLRRTWLVGGSMLAKSFHNLGCITEYFVSIMPYVLGNGISLLADGANQMCLSMTSVKTYDEGVIQAIYKQNKR